MDNGAVATTIIYNIQLNKYNKYNNIINIINIIYTSLPVGIPFTILLIWIVYYYSVTIQYYPPSTVWRVYIIYITNITR